jgi:hypothetical protein
MKKRWEDLLVEQCSPTLAGIKPGSLFRYKEAVPNDLGRLRQLLF